MRNRLIIGVFFIVLGLILAFGPITIFPVCGISTNKEGEEMQMENSESKVQDSSMSVTMSSSMKCHWTARALLGIGVSIAIQGILILLISSCAIRLGITIGIGLNGILGIVIPTWLIGVCASSKMACQELTLPALIIISSFILVGSIINGVFLHQKLKKGINYVAQAFNN